ncbi:hypothetical protein P7K49_032499 [Saguinus oedipus]|uniref:Uncharacterized protein n=1 Tax=Saguinus oedipus TaxID=9490 RepID=A0ABQ9TYE5_SAGOE|nr:hypothetical protein P7K49_032499 [Saguinus oedipus]
MLAPPLLPSHQLPLATRPELLQPLPLPLGLGHAPSHPCSGRPRPPSLTTITKLPRTSFYPFRKSSGPAVCSSQKTPMSVDLGEGPLGHAATPPWGFRGFHSRGCVGTGCGPWVWRIPRAGHCVWLWETLGLSLPLPRAAVSHGCFPSRCRGDLRTAAFPRDGFLTPLSPTFWFKEKNNQSKLKTEEQSPVPADGKPQPARPLPAGGTAASPASPTLAGQARAALSIEAERGRQGGKAPSQTRNGHPSHEPGLPADARLVWSASQLALRVVSKPAGPPCGLRLCGISAALAEKTQLQEPGAGHGCLPGLPAPPPAPRQPLPRNPPSPLWASHASICPQHLLPLGPNPWSAGSRVRAPTPDGAAGRRATQGCRWRPRSARGCVCMEAHPSVAASRAAPPGRPSF